MHEWLYHPKGDIIGIETLASLIATYEWQRRFIEVLVYENTLSAEDKKTAETILAITADWLRPNQETRSYVAA